MTATKVCSMCHTAKAHDQFTARKGRDGLQGRCRECVGEISRQHYEAKLAGLPTREPVGPPATMKTCTRCQVEQPVDNFSAAKKKSTGKEYRQSMCKPCRAAYHAELHQRDPARRAEVTARWRANHLGAKP